MTPAQTIKSVPRALAEVTEMHRTDLAKYNSWLMVLENKNFHDEHDNRQMEVYRTRIAHLRRMIKIGEGEE